MRWIAKLAIVATLAVSVMAQTPQPAGAYISAMAGVWNPWTSAQSFGSLPFTPPAIGLYCQAISGGPWTPCNPGSGGGGDTITSPNGTLNVGGTSSATTLDLKGAAGQIMAGATPALTSTPTLGASGTLGSVTMGNATSGLLTLQTVTGALGTVTVSIPAATDTLVNLAGTQTLTNKSIAGSEINSGTVGATYGGTGANNSSATGIQQWSAGTQSVSTALASGTTATTQAACDSSTKLATTAYAGIVCNLVETTGSPLSVIATSTLLWNNSSGAYVFDLPTPTSGLQFCFGNYKTVAHAISAVPPSGVTIYYKGVAGTAGSSTGLVSSGLAGDFFCVVGTDSTTYEVTGAGQGTLTNN